MSELTRFVASQTIPATGIPADQIDPAIAYLNALKVILPQVTDIEKAFEDCLGLVEAKNNGWVELAVTLRFHHYRGYTDASKHLTPSLWLELVDETIARLEVAKEKEVAWWETPDDVPST